MALRGCPFCGNCDTTIILLNTEHDPVSGVDTHYMRCGNCNAKGPTTTASNVVDLWNGLILPTSYPLTATTIKQLKIKPLSFSQQRLADVADAIKRIEERVTDKPKKRGYEWL